jgi:hypothetical protein
MNDNALFLWAIQQLDGAIPPGLDDLINRVRSLHNLSDWVPSTGGMGILDILSLGVIVSKTDHESFQPLLAKVADAIKATGWPSPDDIAELHAAVLVRPWSDELTCIPRTGSRRTADLLAKIGSDFVEIEVTKAEEKAEQRVRQETGHRLLERLSALSSPYHLVVYFLDSLSEEETDAVVAAASTLSNGSSGETLGRWYVQVGPQTCNTESIELSTNAPTWWPKQYAAPGSFGGTFTLDGVRVKRSSIQIQWGLSDKAYRNPIERKASRSQHSGELPFVIALDATQLPGALGWYGQNLADDLPLWDHVSGVIVFRSEIRIVESIGWSYRLFQNPKCTHPLPRAFLQQVESGKLIVPFFGR